MTKKLKTIKLTAKETQDLQNLNNKKFDSYQKITAITHHTNEQDAQWWSDIYKNHDLDPSGRYEIKGTKEGVYLTQTS